MLSMKCFFLACNTFCPFQQYSQCYMRNQANPLAVQTKDISVKNNKIHEFLQIPVFQGQINSQVLNYINKNIKSDILEFKNEMENAADENAKTLAKQGKPIIPFEISNTYLLTYNKNNILSVSIVYQQYIGGRNSYIRTTYNYDLTTGESMPMSRLFKEGVDYIKILNNLITSKIQENNKAYPAASPNQFKGISRDQPYYLDDNNLVIFLRFNEIASVASEIPVVKIPLSELTSILKPQLLRSI